MMVHMTDWHVAHLEGMAQGDPGFLLTEATAVQPEGRIAPEHLGLWKASLIESTRRGRVLHSQGQKIGVQLGNAGRKAITIVLWLAAQGSLATEAVGGWLNNVKAPSDVLFGNNFPQPKAMTRAKIEEFK